MLIQAAGLAALAALSPTAVLVAAVFLRSPSPHRTVLIYLAGAVAMTVVMAAILFAILRAGDLSAPHQRQPRYDLRLGLGLLMLLVGAWLLRRGPRPPDPAKRDRGLLSRLLARPDGKTAFIVGVLVYAPSLTFIAAVQVIATSRATAVAQVAAACVVIVITVAFAWLPLALYVLAPRQTAGLLTAINQWLRAHGHVLAVAALTVGGAILVTNGILGVTGAVG